MTTYLDGLNRGAEQMVSRQVSRSAETMGEPTSKEIVSLITELHKALQSKYGCDFAYSIAAKGHTIAASNYRQGAVLANKV